MGTFSVTVTLTNVGDQIAAARGYISEKQIRSLRVDASVDTGSWFLVINEKIRTALGLGLTGDDTARLADGSTETYAVTEPVEFRWKDQKKAMNALVIPDADEVLFGALCMEALDVMADPVTERLIGCHGDRAIYRLK